MQVDELLELIGLEDQCKVIVKAMIAGEWKCGTCKFFKAKACVLIDRDNNPIFACNCWQPREAE